MKKNQLEIACFNLQSAIIAQQNGADRIELCADINEGGITPSLEITQSALKELHIDLYVMIRPRGGDFAYSEEEFDQMVRSIIKFKELGVDGFVFGILNEDKSVDVGRNWLLVQLANPYPCTFHRAFDVADNVFQSLEEVVNCGFKTILTSGQEKNVVEGINVLAQLVEKANDRITIMPGGGLRSSNIGLLQEKTKAGFYHSSAIVDGKETANSDEVKALKTNLQ